MSAPPTPTWNLENFRAATREEGGDRRCRGPRGRPRLGEAMARRPRLRQPGPTRRCTSWSRTVTGSRSRSSPTAAGRVGVLYKDLKKHPPFDEEAERRDLTHRLNEIGGIAIPHGRWNAQGVRREARVPAVTRSSGRRSSGSSTTCPNASSILLLQLEAVTGAAVSDLDLTRPVRVGRRNERVRAS